MKHLLLIFLMIFLCVVLVSLYIPSGMVVKNIIKLTKDKKTRVIVLTEDLEFKIKKFYLRFLRLVRNKEYDQLKEICDVEIIKKMDFNFTEELVVVTEIKKISQNNDVIQVEITSRNAECVMHDRLDLEIDENNKIFVKNVIEGNI